MRLTLLRNPWFICFEIVFFVALSDSAFMYLVDHLQLEAIEEHENIIEPIAMGFFALPLIFFLVINPFLKREEKHKTALLKEKQDYLCALEKRSSEIQKAFETATHELKESEERHSLVAEGVNDGIWEFNIAKDKLYLSARWKLILGYASDFEINSLAWWYDQIAPDNKDIIKDAISSLTPDNPSFNVQYQIKTNSNEFIWVVTRGIGVFNTNRQLIRVAGSQTDITKQKETEDNLYHNAYYDQLTSIPNRRLFQDRLAQLILMAQRHPDRGFALLFIDVDNFKKINDSYGHNIGDEYLVKLSNLMVHYLRKTDNVARLGGDEFAVIIENIASHEKVLSIAKKLSNEVRKPLKIHNYEIYPSISIGVVVWNPSYRTLDYMVRDADFALYKAKENGRDCIAVFDEDMHMQAVSLFHKENQLQKALEREEIHVFYQPIMNARSLSIEGFEALIRWNHSELGWVSPSEFIKIAEDSNLILEFGDFVLEESMKQFASWKAQNEALHFISVNISVRQLEDPRLVNRIIILLKDYNVSPSCLKIEVTESTLMKNPDLARNMLRQLSDIGVQIAIDDFGTGYSSLGMVHSFHFDILKLDQCFTKDLSSDKKVKDLVISIQNMSRNLGLKTVVEGVEKVEEVNMLRTIGFDYLQGYYFSKPLSAEDMTQFIASYDNQQEIA